MGRVEVASNVLSSSISSSTSPSNEHPTSHFTVLVAAAVEMAVRVMVRGWASAAARGGSSTLDPILPQSGSDAESILSSELVLSTILLFLQAVV